MYEPKFKVGDIIISDLLKVQMYSRINVSIIQIKKIKKINKTYFYILSGEYSLVSEYLFPSVDIDKSYKLDEVYLRKQKLDKLIYKQK